MKVLVTGTAGFIGYHLAKYLLERGDEVVGLDNINNYYDVNLKYARLEDSGIDRKELAYGKVIPSRIYEKYQFIKLDMNDFVHMQKLFSNFRFDAVCNLAAQAGVRYSLTNPKAYLDANLSGFLNLLECCRTHESQHLVYASSSSVYGLHKNMPFSTAHSADHPVSLYAASKKSNELMAHAYSHLFHIPTTGLRFFTVYGPWGRPDMALFLFTKAILEDREIDIYNNGFMRRDFTYIADIVDGIARVIDRPATGDELWDANIPNPACSAAPYKLYNIGRGKSVELMEFITEIEIKLGKKARKNYMAMQSGDVVDTWADISALKSLMGYEPKTSVCDGINQFINWYQDFYGINVSRTGKKTNAEVPLSASFPA